MTERDWTQVDLGTGRVLRSGFTSSNPDLPDGLDIVRGVQVRGRSHYYKEGRFDPRPELPLDDVIRAGVGQAVILDLPQGTKVRRQGQIIGEAGANPIQFMGEEGVEVLEIIPPFPYKERSVRIEVGMIIPAADARREILRRDFVGLRP